MISTKEKDFLDQDDPIRTQNFVCLSFLSPEDVLKRKEQFFFERYTAAYASKNKEFIEDLEKMFPEKQEQIRIHKEKFNFLYDSSMIQESYKYFVQDMMDDLEREFYETNDFQTSMRGIKVRGVYDTLEEAKFRSEQLRKKDKKFSIYIAQVGCWCPWSPNPDSIADQEFAETELNTLMKNYQENIDNKTEFFELRKENLKQQALSSSSSNILAEDDPWIKQKNISLE